MVITVFGLTHTSKTLPKYLCERNYESIKSAYNSLGWSVSDEQLYSILGPPQVVNIAYAPPKEVMKPKEIKPDIGQQLTLF